MRVIPPISTADFTITAAMLTTAAVAEPSGSDGTAWNSGTTYALDATTYSATTHRRYQSLQAANTNNDPTTATRETPTAWWQDIGPTNRWAMFDTLRDTGTAVAATTAVVEITPGVRVDSVGVAGLDSVTSVLVEVIRSGVTKYTQTVALVSREVTNYYEFCFTPFEYREEFALFNLPPYSDAMIRLTFTGANPMSIGAVMVGMNEYIGRVLHGAENDATNFTTVNRAFDSTASWVRRRNVPKNTMQLKVDKTKVRRGLRLRDTLNAIPAMYVGLDNDADGYSSAVFRLGLYRVWKYNLSNPNHALLNLEVEEL